MVDGGWQANSRKLEGLLSNYVYFAIDIPKISYCYACLILKKVDTMVLYITLNHQSGELLPTAPTPYRYSPLQGENLNSAFRRTPSLPHYHTIT
jgi:hypothetical protein